MLREVQQLDAVAEQRCAALAEVQLPLIEFGQVSDETYGRLALGSRQALHLGEKFGVRELSEIEHWFHLHDRNIIQVGATSTGARSCMFSFADD